MATPAEKQQAEADFTALLEQAQIIAAGRAEEILGPMPEMPKAASGAAPDAQAVAQFLAAEKEYAARLTQLESNPLVPAMRHLEAQRKEETAAQGEETANALYEGRLNEIKTQAMQAVDDDLVHKSAREQSQQTAMQQLLSGNIFGAVMSFLRMIPGVGNLMSMPGNLLQDVINSKGESIDFSATNAQRTRVENMQSALLGIGVGVGNPQVIAAVASVVSPPQAEAQTTPSAADGTSAPARTFDAPNGDIPPPPPASGLTGTAPAAAHER